MTTPSASARDERAVRPRRGRADAARRLSRRPHPARLADRRRARHRQGDAGLSPGALRAGLSRSERAGGAEGDVARRSGRTIRRRGASPDRRTAISWCCERVVNEKTGKLFTEIRVERRPRSVPFFGSTAGEGGWRVAIVDPIEDLNRNGENALLKVLEEPPPRALLLLMTPRARPRAADHPLALPHADPAAAAGRGRGARHGRSARRRRQSATKSAPPRRRPTARSAAR